MKGLHMVAFALVIIGAINWGMIGLFKLNLVYVLFSSVPAVERGVYFLVGLAGLYLALMHKDYCAICAEAMKKPAPEEKTAEE